MGGYIYSIVNAVSILCASDLSDTNMYAKKPNSSLHFSLFLTSAVLFPKN